MQIKIGNNNITIFEAEDEKDLSERNLSQQDFEKHKSEIQQTLQKLKEQLPFDFIVIGSSVLILNGINIGRKVSDIDLLTFGRLTYVARTQLDDFNIDIIHRDLLDHDYDIMGGIKVGKLKTAIEIKKALKKEKHKNDLKFITCQIEL